MCTQDLELADEVIAFDDDIDHGGPDRPDVDDDGGFDDDFDHRGSDHGGPDHDDVDDGGFDDDLDHRGLRYDDRWRVDDVD